MENLFPNLGYKLISVIQQFEIQIPDIALDTKTKVVKFILISEEGQLLTNDEI